MLSQSTSLDLVTPTGQLVVSKRSTGRGYPGARSLRERLVNWSGATRAKRSWHRGQLVEAPRSTGRGSTGRDSEANWSRDPSNDTGVQVPRVPTGRRPSTGPGTFPLAAGPPPHCTDGPEQEGTGGSRTGKANRTSQTSHPPAATTGSRTTGRTGEVFFQF